MKAVMLAILLALLAERDSAGEALLFEVLKASVIVGKLTVEVSNRVPKCFGIVCLRFMMSTDLCHIFYVMSRDNYLDQ